MPDEPGLPSMPEEAPLDIEATLLEIRRKDPRYSLEAYRFAFEALEYTVREYLKLKQPRHVTGRELCEGMRRYALELFGLMALDVWTRWGVTQTRDWGHIIFNLVDARLLRKTDDDNLDDFTDVYDVSKALTEDFKF